MPKAHIPALRIGAAAALAALALGACGGSSNTSGTVGTSTQSNDSSGSNTNAQSASVGASTTGSSTGAVVKEINVSGYGKALGTTGGQPLFELVGGTCDSACERTWPPLTVSGAPGAGAGADAKLLGTTTSAGGKTQVTYAGEPLYSFSGPTAASGEGMAADGGIWYLVGVDGKPIKKTASGGY